MTLTPSRRSLSVGGAALTLLVGASLFPAVAASASAEETVAPRLDCPAATSVVGFPTDPRPFIAATTPITPSEITITGALPDGLSLSKPDPSQRWVVGKPTKAQTSMFTVKAVITNADMTTTTLTKDCTMTIKAAPKVTRIAGTDRYDQSVKVSVANYEKAPVVYLASGEKFSDALSASAVAAEHDAPLLLTPAGSMTDGVIAELKRLEPAKIVVVGGPASVSPAVLTEL